MESDVELLERWAEGSERAGTTLFDRHYRAVFRFFNAKGVPEIEDLVQETFLGIVRNFRSFREDASFRAFLFGVARNVLCQYLRRRGRKEGKLDFETVSIADLGLTPSAVLAQREEQRLLLEGLRRLGVDDQIALELYLWEGLTAPELAGVLGLTEAALRSRLHRAKNRLRELLTEIAKSPELLESTLGDIEGWAAQVRAQLAERAG